MIAARLSLDAAPSDGTKMISLRGETFANGRIVRSPVGAGNGYWAGAPGAFYSAQEKALYLTYRIRRPRGIEPDRGGEGRIARSTDFETFEDIWSETKDKFGTASIERCAIRQGPDGLWRYFVSFVDPADGRWAVSVIEAKDAAKFDPANIRRVFSAAPLGLEGIKDPWIIERPEGFYMFVSVALATRRTRADSHQTLDIFNTGECLSATGRAQSRDLKNWDWQGVVFAPEGAGWDGYCRRINSILPDGRAFYDGSASERENYEEKTGLAQPGRSRDWKSLTPHGPLLTSPHASHSLRYVETVQVGGRALLFYEFARPDGAHELRLTEVEA